MHGTGRSGWMVRGAVWGLALAAGLARAETVYVATNGSDGASGIGDWSNAKLTITSAVSLATNAGDVVWLSNGVYVLDGPEIQVVTSITLRGFTTNADETVIDGGYPTRQLRCLSVNHADALVCHLTIRNGAMTNNPAGGVYIGTRGGTVSNCMIISNRSTSTAFDKQGGGIYGGNSGLIRNCTIAGNSSAGRGGGGGRLGTYEDCLVYGNTAGGSGSGAGLQTPARAVRCVIVSNTATGRGGGIGFESSGNCVLSNCVIAANSSAFQGGGISFYQTGTAEVTEIVGCVISNNRSAGTTTSHGGGIGSPPGGDGQRHTVRLRDCTLVDNRSAKYGGGIVFKPSTSYPSAAFFLDRCRVLRNIATESSGGIHADIPPDGQTFELRNCVVAGNVAGGQGGGVTVTNYGRIESCTIVSNRAAVAGGVFLGPAASATNTIVYSNSAPSHPDWTAAAGAALGYSCVSTSAPDVCVECLTDEPALRSIEDGDFRLSVGSPCLNRGFNQGWMAGGVDLWLGPRIDGFNRRVDIGAYEHMPPGTLWMIR